VPYSRPATRFLEILDNILLIQSYLQGMERAAFEADSRTRDAVERCVERLSEAAAKRASLPAMRLLLRLFLMGVGLLLPRIGAAALETHQSVEAQQSALCTAALRSAEAKYGTPPGLLEGISRAESGRRVAGAQTLQPWPWALNVDGQGFYFPSKEIAVSWASRALARGATFTDVGCMQVNLQFHPKAFRSIGEAYDPTMNADYAARFLLDLFAAAGGNWWLAIGWFHSRTPILAAIYRKQITNAGFGFPSPIIGPGRIRLALTGGGVAVINLSRQPTRWHRRLNPCQVATILAPVLRSPARVKACAVDAPSGYPSPD